MSKDWRIALSIVEMVIVIVFYSGNKHYLPPEADLSDEHDATYR